ncbi:MAG: HDIG domain-containing metalloprotein [Phormidesmis sp.]
MSVLRRLANRIHQLWARLCFGLKNPHHWRVRRRLNQRCTPWINIARGFFGMEEYVHSASSRGAEPQTNRQWQGSAKSKTPSVAINRATGRSTGQTLFSLVNAKSLARSEVRQASKRIWIVTLLAIVLLSACFGQRFYDQPGLDIKSISPQTFYAPESAVFEDKQETEKRRNNVREGTVPLLKIDAELTVAATRSLETLLRQGRELREQASKPLFVSLKILSGFAQDFLLQAAEAQWRPLWRLAETEAITSAQLKPFAAPKADPIAQDLLDLKDLNSASSGDSSAAEKPPSATLSPQITAQISALSPDQILVLQELASYRELSGSQALTQLKARLNVLRQQSREAATELARDATIEGQPLYDYRLFELNDEQWRSLETDSRQIFSEMMAQGVPQGSPPDLLRQAVEIRVKARANSADVSLNLPVNVPTRSDLEAQQLKTDVILSAIAPNLVLDEPRTQQYAEQAVKEIAPVMVSVQKGELIVRADETIDAADFVRLDHFGLTGRYFNWLGLCGFSLLIAAAIAFYLWIDHIQAHQLNQRDHLLVLVLCLVVSVLAALRVPTMGIPAVGLLVASFYGSARGLVVVGLLTLILPIGIPVTTIPLISGTAGAMVGAWFAPQLRAREEFALLGGFVGLTQAVVHLVLTLMRSTVAAPLWKVMFLGSAMQGLYGIAWSVVALGVSPYLEHFFDVVTPIRLAELANPNRPLLKRLATEAPGTFQHTMAVASLAEAAAQALGRNVELVRAGTLYHDIGKMHDPLGFIENQMGGPNKHDLINDPWISASIIKKHVTQGIVMARKYRLPKAVQAFIPEHQGDMKISYFYQQAKAKQASEPSLVVNEADFEYDGPIPQSPETGITMLADSCEAALRSLNPDASMDEAYSMVDKILRARWRNRQMVESGLSRDDMDIIASVFIQVWQQHNHKRIAYPKDALTEEATSRSASRSAN